MLAQISTDEKDFKGALEKLKKSLQIKNAIFSDPDHMDIKKTVLQLNALAAKLGMVSGGGYGNSNLPRLVNVGNPNDRFPNSGSNSSNSSPKNGSPKNRKKMNLKLQEIPQLSDNSNKEIGLNGDENPERDDEEKGGMGEKSFHVNEAAELLKRFIQDSGKIIQEESDDDDTEKEILGQVKKHEGESSSKTNSESDPDDDDDNDEDQDIEKISIVDNPEFQANLSGVQRAQLMKLKDDIFNKSTMENNYAPLMDIINSDFFNSLTPRRRETFRNLNKDLFNPN